MKSIKIFDTKKEAKAFLKHYFGTIHAEDVEVSLEEMTMRKVYPDYPIYPPFEVFKSKTRKDKTVVIFDVEEPLSNYKNLKDIKDALDFLPPNAITVEGDHVYEGTAHDLGEIFNIERVQILQYLRKLENMNIINFSGTGKIKPRYNKNHQLYWRYKHTDHKPWLDDTNNK